MLELGFSVPNGALVGREAQDLARTLTSMEAIWFSAQTDRVVEKDGRITGWRSHQDAGDEKLALTTVPNEGDSKFTAGPPPAMLFTKGVHCGFSLANAMPTAENFTFAVIYSADEAEARSLVALDTGQANNMMFLSDAEGVFVVKDRANGVSVSMPAPRTPAVARLVVVSFNGRELSLATGGQLVQARGKAVLMDRPADLFIGCRSQRAGLTRTLGSSAIHDVILWPNRALLSSHDPADEAALAALNRYHHWTF